MTLVLRFGISLAIMLPICLARPALLFDRPYYLGVSVGSDAEMAPRLPLRGVPYALSPSEAVGSPVRCRDSRELII